MCYICQISLASTFLCQFRESLELMFIVGTGELKHNTVSSLAFHADDVQGSIPGMGVELLDVY